VPSSTGLESRDRVAERVFCIGFFDLVFVWARGPLTRRALTGLRFAFAMRGLILEII